MKRRYRIGCSLAMTDVFWVQVREAIAQSAHQMEQEIIEFDWEYLPLMASGSPSLMDEILSHQVDVLIAMYLSDAENHYLLERGMPVIHLLESSVCHPLLVSSTGFYSTAQVAAQYLVQQVGSAGDVLMVGGAYQGEGEDGLSRIKGFRDVMDVHPDLHLYHLPTSWDYPQAFQACVTYFAQRGDQPFQAIFGLSDSLALAASDALRLKGGQHKPPFIVGVNGDPEAYSAVAEGKLTATVDIDATGIGLKAVQLAYEAAQRQLTQRTFAFDITLVTSENVTQLGLQKLVSIAKIPKRLVRFNLKKQQERLTQLEISREINRHVGAILNRQTLSRTIAHLIRDNYGYDHVHLYLLTEDGLHLEEELMIMGQPFCVNKCLVEAAELKEALERSLPTYLLALPHTPQADGDANTVRSRVLIPIRFGQRVLGLLDLSSQKPVHRTRLELEDLQVLANQLGVALHNIQLYDEALDAKTRAEKADQMKTRLLANVSHELRTPLQVIMAYTQGAIALADMYDLELPGGLQQTLHHILQSGEHVHRLVNDLLDLSRAEIGMLDLTLETITPHTFLQDVFHGLVKHTHKDIDWQLDLPSHLPLIQADPVRLRQVLLNVLGNASKFTRQGRITLSADVQLPHLHLWVQDSGDGIPPEVQEAIFEPFVTGGHRKSGAGLGLYISRQIVTLHHGSITLESRPDVGSTFHIYLPLPSLQPSLTPPVLSSEHNTKKAALLLISGNPHITLASAYFSSFQMLACPIQAQTDILQLLETIQPTAIGWDLTQSRQEDWEIIQRLRHYPRLCQLPFMIYDHAASPTEAYTTTVTGFLIKPLNRSKFIDFMTTFQLERPEQTILIVDDDPLARAYYKQMISEAFPSFTAHMAADGSEALQWLGHNSPALVLLDLIMAEVDGFHVLEALRSDPRTHTTPVLVLSGQMLSYDEIERLDHARVVYHTKNLLDSEEIGAVMETLLTDMTPLPQYTSLLVKRTMAYIHQHYQAIRSRQEIAEAVGVTEAYLSRIVHRELGVSLWNYLNRFRIKRAQELLLTTGETISAIALQVGFENPMYFSRVFHKHIGQTPSAYRSQPVSRSSV